MEVISGSTEVIIQSESERIKVEEVAQDIQLLPKNVEYEQYQVFFGVTLLC